MAGAPGRRALHHSLLAGVAPIIVSRALPRYAHGYRGGAPAQFTISGPSLLVMGDSRVANGTAVLGASLTSTDGALSPFTGAVQGASVLGAHNWFCEAIGYKLTVDSHVSLGGHTSARFASDEALALAASRNPAAVLLYCGVNDTGSVYGYDGIALGDPDADPSTNAAVGAMPATPGTGLLGTTLGNLHKIISYFDALGIPVIAMETPKDGGTLSAYIQKWYYDREQAGTYSNFINFNAYEVVAASPDEWMDPATATGNWRTDLDASLGTITNNNDKLHPSPVGARLIGQAMAADSRIIAAVSELTSQGMVPDGTNDASYLNGNPHLEMGSGSGTKNGGITGSLPDGWNCTQNFSGGTVAVSVDAIADGQGVRFTLDRTGGPDATTRVIQLYNYVSTTPAEGDGYVLESHYDVPARPGDIYAVRTKIVTYEAGLLDDEGTAITSTAFSVLSATSAFPQDGEAGLKVQTPSFDMTPGVVASATGTLTHTSYIEIMIPNDIDTSVDGQLVIDVYALGFRKL